MRVPDTLSNSFGSAFEELIGVFAAERGMIPEPASIFSERFLSRSVIPHVKKLSALFNRQQELESGSSKETTRERIAEQQAKGLDPYWKESSNPAHLRLAYFLYFMPSNLFRVSSVWSELHRLGFRWPAETKLQAIEFGAGPATGACGISMAENVTPVGLPAQGTWALIEQDRAMLQIGEAWAAKVFGHDHQDWGVRPFHRKVDLATGLLPRNAPEFNLWVMSYFLNEIWNDPAEAAKVLLNTLERHLSEKGLVILVEPALKQQSRKLLELRRELLRLAREQNQDWLKILLPCLGHQECGALKAPEDWCHEEVTWMRPSYFKTIDKMAGLDRRSLPFSYLVITRDERPMKEILSELREVQMLHRLVSPSFSVGSDLEFYTCGPEGKRRARYRPPAGSEESPGRGDLLCDSEIRGDVSSSRIEKVNRIR